MTDNDESRAWDIIEKIGVCMLTTVDGGVLRARPMQAMSRREEGCIWFLTDARSHKDAEIEADSRACLSFAAPDDNAYVSVSGAGAIVQDPAMTESLWSPFAQAWFPEGPADPNVRLLRFEPESAEFWTGPSSSVVIAFRLAQARFQGETPELGENRKLDLS